MTTKAKWEKEQQELHERQDEQARERFSHRPVEVHENVVVDDGLDDGGEPKTKDVGEIHVVGGRAYVKVDGEFSQDDLTVFRGQLDRSFQAVQR